MFWSGKVKTEFFGNYPAYHVWNVESMFGKKKKKRKYHPHSKAQRWKYYKYQRNYEWKDISKFLGSKFFLFSAIIGARRRLNPLTR